MFKARDQQKEFLSFLRYSVSKGCFGFHVHIPVALVSVNVAIAVLN